MDDNRIEENCEILNKVIDSKCIYPVYQPIVSLSDGSILGYEGLSRISDQSITMSIEMLFHTADQINRAWDLEYLCRKETLTGAKKIDKSKKLFLNINPNIIKDEKFKEGFTKTYLERYHINPENIIFEVTERIAATDHVSFIESIAHYKKQNYSIAIDDMGSGYSGLNFLVDVRPSFLKMDKKLVRNIDKDPYKSLLAQSFVTFCKGANIKLIAEGIETEEELRTLIRLGFDFGQGYYLCKPQREMCDIESDRVALIQSSHKDQPNNNVKLSYYPKIESVCKEGAVFAPDTMAVQVLDEINKNPEIQEFCIIDAKHVIGFMTKGELIEAFGGRFGFSLHAKKAIAQLMKPVFLKVDCKTPIDLVAKSAMARSSDQLYSPIIVEKNEEYYGIATVKDLLESSTKVEIEHARHSNPLTGLPGNVMIEKEIIGRLSSPNPYCIMYVDVDNFKPYNDLYGFENGDLMLLLVAEILKECAQHQEFVGHIGGDDFIVIADYQKGGSYCQNVINLFSSRVLSLYQKKDIKSGYIVSKNRYGVIDKFPLATLSIAGITDRMLKGKDLYAFSNKIASVKKYCKHQKGNYYKIQ